jgi:hypothetical protein
MPFQRRRLTPAISADRFHLQPLTGHKAVGTLVAESSIARGIVSRVASASSRSLWITTTYGMPSAALLLGFVKTSYWAISHSPRPQVGAWDAVRFKAGVLRSNPVAKLGLERLLAIGAVDDERLAAKLQFQSYGPPASD